MVEPVHGQTLTIETIEKAIGHTFTDEQKRGILSQNRKFRACCGRKWGKTDMVAARRVRHALECPEGRTLVTAKTKDTAAELYQYITKIIRLCGIEVKEMLATRTVLANGHRIELVSPGPTGYAIRPKSYCSVACDEAGFMEDEVYTDAIFAALAVTWHHEDLLGTPNPEGNFGFFYDSLHDDEAFVISGDSEQQQHVSRDWLKAARRRMTKEAYDREVRGIWGSVADAYFPENLIRACVQDFDKYKFNTEAQIIFLGVDFARFGEDYNAIVWAGFNPQTRQVTVYNFEKVDSKNRMMHVVGKIVNYCKDERIVRVVTDETGVGGGATDALIERLGNRRVVGISNQKRGDKEKGWRRKLMKEDMYSTVKLAMEEGRVIIHDTRAILGAMKRMRQKFTQTGDTMIHGKEDHIVEALVRACYLPLSGQAKGYGNVYLIRL